MPEEFVSRKRGEKEVPKAWTPKYDMIEAMNEINSHIEESVKSLKAAGRPEEDIEKRKAQKLDSIADFVSFIEDETSPERIPTIDMIGKGASPWAYSTQALIYTEYYPRKARFKGTKKGLEKKLQGLDYFKGLKIVYEDFGVPEVLGKGGYFHYPATKEAVKDYAEKMNVDPDAVTNYSKPPFKGKEWPSLARFREVHITGYGAISTLPQQIAFVWKKPPEARGKMYDMVFVRATEPVVVGGGEIVWRPPHAVTTTKAYTMAREILGSQRAVRTYGLEPSGTSDRIKVDVIAPADLPPESRQVRF